MATIQAAQAVITTSRLETTGPKLVHTFTIPRPGNNPAYRRHVYHWMRQEMRMPHAGGQISKWTALKAWKHSKRYVEALS
jgi:hypothetical protein